jgi:hypothetical protein
MRSSSCSACSRSVAAESEVDEHDMESGECGQSSKLDVADPAECGAAGKLICANIVAAADDGENMLELALEMEDEELSAPRLPSNP